MKSKEFYDLLKVGEELLSLEKEAVLEEFKTPEIFGIELTGEPVKAKEMAEALGVGTIHTSKIFGGVFMLQFISEMITNWLPSLKGWVEGGKLTAKFTKPVKFNERLTCGGCVKGKSLNNRKKYLICDVWIENVCGDKVLTGEAHIVF